MREQLLDAGLLPVKSVIDVRDGGTLLGFEYGRHWVVQQIKARTERPPIPG
jgi:hypothetical protein